MEGNHSESVKRNKPLEVGTTVIGTRTGLYKNKMVSLPVKYGNYIYPPIGDEYIHLKPNRYYDLLNKFLHSEEGKEYIYPSRDEIEEASKLVICRESLSVLEEKPVKEESKNQQETIQKDNDLSSNNQDFSNLKNSLKILVGIVIIQFVCVIGLIVMLVIR